MSSQSTPMAKPAENRPAENKPAEVTAPEAKDTHAAEAKIAQATSTATAEPQRRPLPPTIPRAR